jgi:glycosyltransferase involved in cell wall biosynthesis
MLREKSVAVIVPAYNEEKRIAAVITSMPSFVDRIIVIDDGSTDATAKIVLDLMNDISANASAQLEALGFHNLQSFHAPGIPPFTLHTKNFSTDRIILLQHHQNCGKGAGIKTGYHFAKHLGIDCIATMDGDGQMNPEELEKVCLPVILGVADYSKGDRFKHKDAWTIIPPTRLWGNLVLSLLTKPASGYWKVRDTQTGFTAISKAALHRLPIEDIYAFYGYPNDILVKLNIADCTIKEVNVQPIYHDISHSKMKIYEVIPKISWLLTRSFFQRIWAKYLFKQFHPIFLLFHLAIVIAFIGVYLAFTSPLKEKTDIAIYLIASLMSGITALLWDYMKTKHLYID